MQTLLLFLFRYRAFMLFVALEVLGLALVVQNNRYQGATFLHSANDVVARTLAFSQSIRNYLNLRDQNAVLAAENARLRNRRIEALIPPAPSTYRSDSALLSRFSYVAAQVVNNSTAGSRNYLTLDKGTLAGVRPGMGVITSTGVAGRVQYCSAHFATAISLLHTDLEVSAQLSRLGVNGRLKWPGHSPRQTGLKEVPRHEKVQIGDTVVTSLQNSVFPPGLFLGTVSRATLPADAGFWNVEVALATNFYTLGYVYIVDNTLKTEQEALEAMRAGDRR